MKVPTKDGRTVLMMNHEYFQNDQLSDPLEKALASGIFDPTKVMANTNARDCRSGQNQAVWGVDGGHQIAVGTTHTTVENGSCIWSVKLGNCSKGDCDFPRYLNSKLEPIPESEAPEDLRNAKFPEKKGNRNKYDQISPQRSCVVSPGPSDSSLYCVQTLKGGKSSTWVGFKWYRFVDQPGLQQAHLTDSEKSFMQQRIETMHKMVSRTSRWIKAKSVLHEGLATIDSAALVTPPAGMEYGHVPIAVYEGPDKPDGCGGTARAEPRSPAECDDVDVLGCNKAMRCPQISWVCIAQGARGAVTAWDGITILWDLIASLWT